MNNYIIVYPNEINHHGVRGMKWGVRRYQNKNGSLTKDGYNRYYTDGKLNRRGQKAKARAEGVKRAPSAVHYMSAYGQSYVRSNYLGGKRVANYLNKRGALKVAQIAYSGGSKNKARAIWYGHKALALGVKAWQVAPLVKTSKRSLDNVRYNYSDSYKKRTDALANLSAYEKTQRKKG